MTKDEALWLALEALDAITDDVDGTGLNSMRSFDASLEAITAIREALASEASEQPAPVAQVRSTEKSHKQQEQGDSNCQDADGCPTEMAVLQRFWRGEPIPTEHYPAWFKSAQQQEPMAIGWQRRDGTLHRGCPPIGEYDGWTPLYTTPPRREWVGLTDEDLAGCDDEELKQARYWDQMLREKNT